MQIKEKTLCTFTQKDTRLQLVKILMPVEQITHNENFKPYKSGKIWWRTKYQVRLNRKIIHKSISEYEERKVFATNCQNIVLQLKIY